MRFGSALIFLGYLASSVLADFHIGRSDFTQQPTNPDNPPVLKWSNFIACPSNYYKCNCFGQLKPDRGVMVNGGSISKDFRLKAGLCGMGEMDFYYRSNTGTWEFYVHGGDGKLQGTCYTNHAESEQCGGIFSPITAVYYDEMVCYSYICNP